MCFNLSISPRTLPPVLALHGGLQFLHSLDKPLLYDLQLDGDGTQVDVEDLKATAATPFSVRPLSTSSARSERRCLIARSSRLRLFLPPRHYHLRLLSA